MATTATSLLLQAQRIPIGEFVAPNGRKVEVTVTLQWYKAFTQLARQAEAGGNGGSTDANDDEGIGPGDALGALLGRVGAGDDASGPEAGAFAGALLVHALERLQALETDQGVSALRAQVAALEDRIELLEEEAP